MYLSKTAKLPTDDSLFRYLEDRSKISYTSRNFFIDGAVGTVVAGTNYSVTVDDNESSPASVDFLVKGMVVAVRTVGADDTAGYGNAILRIENAPVDNGADTTFLAKCISVSGVSGSNSIADNDPCQIIGSAYAEGSGSPDVFSEGIDDNYGYTQIFKTAAEVTNTAYATQLRGYSNEFERVLAMKMREHKIDIERAMLFNQKARINGIQYSEGLVGHIIKNSTFVDASAADPALKYESGKAYAKQYATSELTYDALLGDFEVLFDPARGGSNERLALASLPVISYFNKMGDGAFVDKSTESTQYQINMDELGGAFGHQLMEINTVHGSIYLVKEPLFRGHSSGLMLMADMSNMILTEAGLEVCLPESHYLINLEGV